MGETEPRVLCVMLTRDREALARETIKCFQRQTYQNKLLLIWDSSDYPLEHNWNLPDGVHLVEDSEDFSIGMLRNRANEWPWRHSETPSEIIAHWDDDDWSHPNRLTEQVALLRASGADAVGYNEMLFWRCEQGMRNGLDALDEAWLYSNPRPNYALGTSLTYWRKTWERSQFTDGPKPEGTSEYHHWFAVNNRIRVEGVSSVMRAGVIPAIPHIQGEMEPRMIARIHGSNTGSYDIEAQIKGGSREWKRVPSWDARVRDILEGK